MRQATAPWRFAFLNLTRALTSRRCEEDGCLSVPRVGWTVVYRVVMRLHALVSCQSIERYITTALTGSPNEASYTGANTSHRFHCQEHRAVKPLD